MVSSLRVSSKPNGSLFRPIPARPLFRALLLGFDQLSAPVVREQGFGAAILLRSDVWAWRIYGRHRLWLRLRVFSIVRVFCRVSRRARFVLVDIFVEKAKRSLAFRRALVYENNRQRANHAANDDVRLNRFV